MDLLRKIQKRLKIFILGIGRKNKVFLQYPIGKFNVFFQLSEDRYKKASIILLNNTVVFLGLYNNSFHILLFLVFDLQEDCCSGHDHTDGSSLFLHQKSSYITRDHISVSYFFLLHKDFDTFHVPLFKVFLCFSR